MLKKNAVIPSRPLLAVEGSGRAARLRRSAFRDDAPNRAFSSHPYSPGCPPLTERFLRRWGGDVKKTLSSRAALFWRSRDLGKLRDCGGAHFATTHQIARLARIPVHPVAPPLTERLLRRWGGDVKKNAVIPSRPLLAVEGSGRAARLRRSAFRDDAPNRAFSSHPYLPGCPPLTERFLRRWGGDVKKTLSSRAALFWRSRDLGELRDCGGAHFATTHQIARLARIPIRPGCPTLNGALSATLGWGC